MAGDDETTLSGMVRVARIPLATAYRGFVQLLDAGLVVRGTRSRGRRVAKPFRLTENGQRIGRLLVEVSNAFSATWFPEDA